MKAFEQHTTRALRAVGSRNPGRFLVPALSICSAALMFAAPARATVLLNDTFSDGDRIIRSLPTSGQWFSGGPASNLSVSAETGLTFEKSNGNKAMAMAYFAPTDLIVGQSISLSFNYSFQSATTAENSLMFGLYNSGGVFLTKDNSSFNNAIFDNYTGYATSGVFGVDASGSGLDHIEVRNVQGHDLLNMDTYTQGADYVQSGASSPGTIYTASMQITRTESGLTVESKIGNTEMVQKYSAEMFTRFDTVGIFANNNTGTFTVNDISIEYMGAPEPSTGIVISLFGLLVFGKSLGTHIKRATAKLPLAWLGRRSSASA